tara:strand:- start:580 stop:684 length:105 start_codon:yes stop_codon:yes gene_type:complete
MLILYLLMTVYLHWQTGNGQGAAYDGWRGAASVV